VADKTLVTPITAQYVLLQSDLPGQPKTPIGVLLLDPATGHLYKKLQKNSDEVLKELAGMIDQWVAEEGAGNTLRRFEESLSNALLITARETVQVVNFHQTLDRLYREQVGEAKVIPFETHLPRYSLRAAAGKFGQDMEVEAEGWVEAPERLRLTSDMFVARVEGRSMEPLIGDGSLCVFRAGVTGSRQGKRLLVQVMGSSESGGEYTVKRYSSTKIHDEVGEWRHDLIRLDPLNPEFAPMSFRSEDEHLRFRVIAEFVQVLEPNA
jgi:phage repressor protein C with HTH and peptisase S24 domain